MAESKRHDWGLIVAGALLVLLAIFITAFPGLTLATITAILGAGFLVSGILDLVGYVRLKGNLFTSPSPWMIVYAVLDIMRMSGICAADYYGETGFVTKEVKQLILGQINTVLKANYTNYDEALKAFLTSQGLSEQEFTYHIGRLLQKEAYDLYLENEVKAHEYALEK